MKKYDDVNLKQLKSKITSGVMWLETLLAIFIIISVILSSKDVISFIIKVFTLDAVPSYDMFQKFLSHILLLVIALELALMLVKHTPGSVVEVMLYAIARKMLVYGSSATEILLGVLSLAVIFFVKKYLFLEQDKQQEEQESLMDKISMDKNENHISNKTMRK